VQDIEFRQLVERIKLRSPIEEIVGERVSELKKKGALYWARCPFHEERTPSFAVDPRKATWRCYGACGEGGDVLSFIERFDGLGFLDALRLLAQSCGEELPERMLATRSRAEDARGEERYEVLRRAERLYTRLFQGEEGAAARAYLAKRGLVDETNAAFGIGWAPRHGSPLLEAARRSGFGVDVLVETGLVKRSDDGRTFDFFRGRLMIPIRDRIGRTVGFGARVLPEDEAEALGKYVNTPETPLFHKGRLIYGLDGASEAIRKTRQLVLVEGYTDVMAAYQTGRKNVAAVLGTSTTDEHAGLIRRTGAQRVTLLFDGDEAGRKASYRALAGLLPVGVEVSITTLAAGTDPCELLLAEGGGEAFDAEIEGAREWFVWALEDMAGLRGASLAAAADELFALIACLGKAVERSARLSEMAAALSLPEEDLRVQWRQFEERRRARPAAARSRSGSASPPGSGAPDRPPVEESPGRSSSRDEEVFGSLLGALLVDNSLIPLYSDLEERCPEGPLRTIFATLLELTETTDDPIDGGRILTALADHPARSRVVLLEEAARCAESPEALARDQRDWLDRRVQRAELEQLKETLSRSVHSFDDAGSTNDVLKDLHAKLRHGRVPRPTEPQTNP